MCRDLCHGDSTSYVTPCPEECRGGRSPWAYVVSAGVYKSGEVPAAEVSVVLSFLALFSCVSYRPTFTLIDRHIMDEKDTKTVLAEPPQHTEATLPNNEKDSEIQLAPPQDYSAPKAKTEQLEDARGWESENLIQELDKQLEQSGYKKGFFDLEFKNPKHFTWMLVAFASMGGLLSGLDQSLISGANLTLPKALGLTDQQNSLVNSGMPLGGMFLTSAPSSKTLS